MKVERRLPAIDFIERWARFWDTHDLTDSEGELKEVHEPIFVWAKGTSLNIDLRPLEATQLTRIARSKGVKEATVVRHWILERPREASVRKTRHH